MKAGIVHSSEPVALVGGAEVNHDVLTQALQLCSVVVAADSGAAPLLARGVMPEAVIGDMDSAAADVMAKIPSARVHRSADQETTDFEKCLCGIEAPVILGVGFTGARLDHQLAALAALVRFSDRRCVLLSETDLVFLAPPMMRLNLPVGSRFSLFPMAAVEGISEGLRWPINGLNLAPDGRVGTSNEVSGDVMLSVTVPKMLVILPRAALAAVLEMFAASPAAWPARATLYTGQPRP